MNCKAEYLLEYRLNNQKRGLKNIKYVKLKWAYRRFTALKDKCNYLQLVKFEEGYKPNIIFKI